MKIEKTEIQGCFLIQPEVFNDERGYFVESFNHRVFFDGIGRFVDFIQDNESCSNYGVIRGLHTQIGERAQAKLIRVVRGKILDVIIDVRPNSSTFGHIVQRILDSDNKQQLFVPKGCLHGFSVLEDDTVVSYKCDAYYDPESEIGVMPFDAHLGIDWRVEKGKELISIKDKKSLSWEEFTSRYFTYEHKKCLIRSIHPEYSPVVFEEDYQIEPVVVFVDQPFISSAQGL